MKKTAEKTIPKVSIGYGCEEGKNTFHVEMTISNIATEDEAQNIAALLMGYVLGDRELDNKN